MRPIYELVTAAELKVGDFVSRMGGNYEEFEVSGVKLSGLFEHLIIYPTFGTNWHSTEACMSEMFLRRIPATDDPRVLRRALEIACSNPCLHDNFDPVGESLEQACYEIENEVTS